MEEKIKQLVQQYNKGGFTQSELEWELLNLYAVSWRSEQFVCLCPRTKEDNCDRKEPCKECETCPHLRQTNCH